MKELVNVVSVAREPEARSLVESKILKPAGITWQEFIKKQSILFLWKSEKISKLSQRILKKNEVGGLRI